MSTATRYSHLSREELVARLAALEPASDEQPQPKPPQPTAESSSSGAGAGVGVSASSSSGAGSSSKRIRKVKPAKSFNFASHPTRHIALLVAYHGWPYSGLAIQSDRTESDELIPTVEAELLKALEKTRLVEAGKGFEGCGYSRCGRTDRGVSGEGQVVDLWVRSNRKDADGGAELVSWRAPTEAKPTLEEVGEVSDEASVSASASASTSERPKKPLPPSPAIEFPYPRLLNGVLPSSIRVLAWSPVDSEFNSRFSCKYRHYKYAFHLQPTPSSPPLDLELMQQGADLLVGEHDFRNFCKLDGSKQIENHSRRVVKAYFEHVDGMIIFNLIGTAFLWHQVRHVIGVLLLVGSKLEQPSLVSSLLDVEKNPSKPQYQMGDPLPLTLYECGYEPGLDWRYGGYDGTWSDLPPEQQESVRQHALGGSESLERDLESMRQEAEIRTWQIGGALRTLRSTLGSGQTASTSTVYPTGGGQVVITGKYRPVLERPRGETPDEVNRKWREKGGKARKGLE
jgi:tRNA pseudouridine38/39 synthase